jgi:DNA-binding transcriptional ArsR family regulator
MNLEHVLSSRPRLKILMMLVQLGELNVSEIARRLGTNYDATSKHLRILEDEGILQHKTFGRIRLYRLNLQSTKTRALQTLIEIWEQSEKHEC